MYSRSKQGSKQVERNYRSLFLRFQTEEQVLRVNKNKIIVENTFNRDEFGIEGKHGSSINEKICLDYFCRFMTSALTLRSRKTLIHVFRPLLALATF